MSQIGTIDCGYLATVQLMAADRWLNSGNKKDYIADVESAKALLENQGGVNLVELKDSGKDRTIALEWPEKCAITVGECTDDCTIDGADVTPVCKEYETDCIAETSFKVSERIYRNRTMDMQQAISENLLRAMKAMDEKVAALILAGLDANAGINGYTAAPGLVVGDLTYIASGQWNEYLFGYLALVARMNKMKSPVVLDGTNLFQLYWNKEKEAANADGKGSWAKLTSINTPYFDPENLIGDYAGKTYIFDAGSAYFGSKAWNPQGAANALKKAGDRYLYSMPSNNLPGIVYDVYVQETCSGNDFHVAYKLQLHGGFYTNPYPCDETNTGILVFKCGLPA